MTHYCRKCDRIFTTKKSTYNFCGICGSPLIRTDDIREEMELRRKEMRRIAQQERRSAKRCVEVRTTVYRFYDEAEEHQNRRTSCGDNGFNFSTASINGIRLSDIYLGTRIGELY